MYVHVIISANDQMNHLFISLSNKSCPCSIVYISAMGGSYQTKSCFIQWQQLLSLFSHMDVPSREREGLKDLQHATTKFQEITLSIRDDPRLLSLLGKRRGQKGFRELQGDQLRRCIQEVDSALVRSYTTNYIVGPQ